jgi:hypothetical protein
MSAVEQIQKSDGANDGDVSKTKKPTRKELKKQQKRNEYEKGLQAMGSKLHNINTKEDQSSTIKKGGIGSGAEVGDQFTVSQQVKTDAQLNLMETAVDIKV